MSYEDDEPVYGSVGTLLDGLGLHPSHRWVYFTEGDCFDGIHAGIQCEWCEIMPVGFVCYFEARQYRDVPATLAAQGVEIRKSALLPCREAEAS